MRPRLLLGLLLPLILLLPSVARGDDDEDDLPDLVGETVRMDAGEAKRVLAQALLAGAGKQAEINYLVRRQQAAYMAGDGAARIQALRRLVELTSDGGKTSRYLGFLWTEEWRNGNQSRALVLGEQLLNDASQTASQRAAYAAILGHEYITLGNEDKARNLLAQAQQRQREAAKAPNNDANFVLVQIDILRAEIGRRTADFATADAAIQHAQETAEAELVRARKLTNPTDRNLLSDRAQRVRDAVLQAMIWLRIAEGRNIEAETTARIGLRNLQTEQRSGTNTGNWLGRLAQAKLAQRRYEQAVDTARQAIDLLQKNEGGESSHQMLTTQTMLLQALIGLERWADADQLAAQIREATANDPAARSRIDSPTLRTVLDLSNGRLDAAAQAIDISVRYRTRNYGEQHPATIEAKAIRAMVRQARKDNRQALSDYGAVFKAIFSQETSFTDAEPAGLRGFYLPLALRSYLRLVQTLYQENGNRLTDNDLIDDSFRVADRLRASVVQRALIDSAARLAAATPELAGLIGEERRLQTQARETIGQLTRQLEEDQRLTLEQKEREKHPETYSAADAQRDKQQAKLRADAITASRQQITDLESRRGQTLVQIGQRFPRYQALVNPKPPTLSQIGKLLTKGEALLSVYPTPTGTFVWGVNGDGTKVFLVSPLTAADIKSLAGQLRRTLDLGEEPDPSRVPFDFDASYTLYQNLVGPALARLPNTRSLTVAVTGDLAQVPLAVLVSRKPDAGADPLASAAWLVKDYAVNQISTATAFTALRDNRSATGAGRAFAGFGDPLFKLASAPAPAKNAPPPPKGKQAKATTPSVAAQPAASPASSPIRRLMTSVRRGSTDVAGLDFDYGKVPPLPDTREEVLALAQLLGADPAADTYLGAAASRKTVLSTDLSDRRILAFSTHGLKPGDLPGLSRPALALAATGNPAESPLLTLDDVLTLKLNADWVILSACNTASDDGTAEEALSGLARGFYFAGSRAVLATGWAVETRSARQLVTRTIEAYSRNPSQGRAESLRQAQLELIAGKSEPAFRHPFYWAAYLTAGDPGR